MNAPRALVVALVRLWTKAYTWRLPRIVREERRREIESDLWESQREATQIPVSLHIAVRWLRGMPADLSWRGRYRDAPRGSLRAVVMSFLTGDYWDSFSLDVRQTVGSLSRRKKFALTAIVSFALGIGANIAVFSIVDRLMFRPLPFGEPHRLVQVHSFLSSSATFSAAQLPSEIAYAIASEAQTIDGLAWVDSYSEKTVPAPGESPLSLVPTTANFLSTLKVQPILGTGFSTSRESYGGERPVILSYETWRSRFGSPSSVDSIHWASTRGSFRVVGVLPKGFFLPSSHFVETFDGIVLSGRARNGLGSLTVAPFARLRPGASVKSAQAEVAAILRRHDWASPGFRGHADGGPTVTVQSLQAGMSVVLRPYLWILMTAVWTVLVVACVNLATLFVSRSWQQQHESALRIALGASRARVIRLAVLEAAVLCTAGGAIALLVCYWTRASIATVVPPTLRGFSVTPLDLRVVGIAFGVSLCCAAVTSIMPAIQSLKVDLVQILQNSRKGANGSLSRVGAAFLAAESLLGTLLLVGAFAVVPPFINRLVRSPGFEASDLYVIDVGHDFPNSAASSSKRVPVVLATVRELPHVQDAAAALVMPLKPSDGNDTFWKNKGLSGDEWAITAGFFQTLRTPIVIGRSFTEAEIDGNDRAVVLNRTAAQLLWPGTSLADVLSKQIQTSDGLRQVIGVAEDLRTQPTLAPLPAMFLPITTSALTANQSALPVVVRMSPTAVPDRELLLRQLNRAFPENSISVESVNAAILPQLDQPRFLAVLFAALAAVALLLAGVGLFAVATLEASRRKYEMALRSALGAPTRDIRLRMFRMSLVPVMIGTGAGLLAVRFMTRWFDPSTIGVENVTVWTYALSAAVMATIALVASWSPTSSVVPVDLSNRLKLH